MTDADCLAIRRIENPFGRPGGAGWGFGLRRESGFAHHGTSSQDMGILAKRRNRRDRRELALIRFR
jgi:hypothetical protein